MNVLKSSDANPDTDIPASPLLTCLVALTKMLGKPLSAESLTAGLPLKEQTLTPDLFIRAAERAGFVSQMLERKPRELTQLICPAIILFSDNSGCILKDVDTKNKEATIVLPHIVLLQEGVPENEAETRVVSFAELEAASNGSILLIKRCLEHDSRSPSVLQGKRAHWFWSTIFRSRKIYRDVLVASLIINLLALASPFFVMNVYDRVVPNNAIETLWMLAIGCLIAFSFDFVLKWLRSYCIDIAGKKSDILLSSKIMEHVLGLDMAARPASVGSFAKNMQEFESIREFITSSTISTLIDIPFTLLLLAVIFLIGGPIVFVPAGGVIAIMVYSFLIQKPLKESIEKTYRASAQKNASLIENLTGLESLRLYGAASQMQDVWERSVGHISRWSMKGKQLSQSATLFAGYVQNCVTVLIVLVGVYLISAGEASMGALIACVMLSGRAMGPIIQIASLSTRYNQARAALEGLQNVMDMPEERNPEKAYMHLEKCRGDIEITNLSFTYGDHPIPAIKDLTLKMKAGEKVGVIGKIGSGKSTFAKLLSGLYKPSEGLIRLDDININQIDPAERQRLIGCVPQDVNLFFGTVKYNITLGAEDVDIGRVAEVAKIAGVMDFVNLHPDGMDMPVAERGANLSGGQRQAIVLARALLRDPPILILDEPTSAMDPTTEAMVIANIQKYCNDKTIILITHRTSLLNLLDKLAVLDQGELVAYGAKDGVIEAVKNGKIPIH